MPAQTTIHSDGSVTIQLDADAAWWLGDRLNEWDSWAHWTKREECQNWKRSPIARENRRESITYSNCLGEMMTFFGRREMLKLMALAKPPVSE